MSLSNHPFYMLLLSLLVVLTNKVVGSSNSILFFENYTAIADTFCLGGGSNLRIYNDLESAILTNVSFDPVLGWNMWTREICDPKNNPLGCKDSTYNLEGWSACSIMP
jgi:hypothetical protein